MKKTLLVIAMSTVLAACGSSTGSKNSDASEFDLVLNDTEDSNDIQDDTEKAPSYIYVEDDYQQIPSNTQNNQQIPSNTQNNQKVTVDKGKNTVNETKEVVKVIEAFGKYPLDYTDKRYRRGYFIDGVEYGENLDVIELSKYTLRLLPNHKLGVTPNRAAWVHTYKDSQFGLIDPARFNWQAFSQGFVTKKEDMPYSDGMIIYRGHAFGFKGDSTKEIAKGKSTLYINFGKRELVGHFKDWNDTNMPKMKISARIYGNTIYNSDGTSSVRGQFYGKNATEVGGVAIFHNEDAVVAFGARK